VSIQIEVSASG